MPLSVLDNFYLSEEELENSPSRQHGIDRETEATLRIYGCELVQEAGILLQFPQAAMATGQVLFNRFYCKRSMKDYNVKKVAAAALWLGAKLEEVPEVSHHPEKLVRKVLVTVDRICSRREDPKPSLLEPSQKAYASFKDAVVRYEREMLRAFGFITHVHHPHKQMLNYCHVIGADQAHHDLMQEAWSTVNDSLRTTLCVRFKPHVIACGAIFYAARRLGVALPEDPPWWGVFGVEEGDMYAVARALHDLYSRPRAEYIPVSHKIIPSKPPTPVLSPPAGGAARPLDASLDRREGLAPPPRLVVGDGADSGGGVLQAAAGAAATATSATAEAANGGSAAPRPSDPGGPQPQQQQQQRGRGRSRSRSRTRSRSRSASRDRKRRRRSRSRSRSRDRGRRLERGSSDGRHRDHRDRDHRDRDRPRGDSRHGGGHDGRRGDDRGGNSSGRDRDGRPGGRDSRGGDRGHDRSRGSGGGGLSRGRSRSRSRSRGRDGGRRQPSPSRREPSRERRPSSAPAADRAAAPAAGAPADAPQPTGQQQPGEEQEQQQEQQQRQVVGEQEAGQLVKEQPKEPAAEDTHHRGGAKIVFPA